MDNITKEGFHGYYTKSLSEGESKVFVCSHIISSCHEMVRTVGKHYKKLWDENHRELVQLYQNEQLKALQYYLTKYPQKGKVFIGTDLREMVKEFDLLDMPNNSMIKKFGVLLKP